MGRFGGRRMLSARELEKVTAGIWWTEEMGHGQGQAEGLPWGWLMETDGRVMYLGEILQPH